MPEGLEAEIWRRDLEAVVGRRIERVEVDERVADPGISSIVGERFTAARRHGKVVLLDTSGPVVGLRFGMTGRIEVDGAASIDSLVYASGADRSAWDRLRIWAGGHEVPAVRMNDPRRLGRICVNPDLGGLGPDVLDLDLDHLAAALARRTTGVKAALMNQGVVAGLGNLCVDEVLFTAGVDPVSSARALDRAAVGALHAAIVTRLPAMLAAGGSTHGVLDPDRRARLGPCPAPRCHGHLTRIRVGGRGTVYCPQHQAADLAT